MFCRHCGTENPAQAGFCSGCGAKTGDQRAAPQPIPAPERPSPRQPLKNKLIDLLIIPVAVILILLGIGQLALGVAGRTATAQVIGYEQVLFINNDDSTRNPSRYKLEYQFSVNGERYTGSVTRVFSGGSHMRQTIPVRYLPFWPHVNAEDGETAGLAAPVMTGLGAALLVLEVKRKSRLRNEKYG
jgi:hypothetical protein